MTLTPGEVINNRYRIVKLLGQGGFGAVYRAWDLNFEVACALKENIENTPEAQRQFVREAQIIYTLRHSNLPQVKDYFQIPGQGQYLVMDYVEGEDLLQKLEHSGRALPQEQALAWTDQICDALIYLHGQTPPVIHRDIKPANIKITPQGTAVLVDFGIAKKFDPQSHTTAGARAVTPGYSPFEQYGKAQTDVRTDVYALGATLYTLLTYHEPTDSIARMAGADLPTLRQLNPAIPPEIESIILRAMQLMPENRYQSVAEFKMDLKGISQLIQPAIIATAAAEIPPRSAAPATQIQPKSETAPVVNISSLTISPAILQAIAFLMTGFFLQLDIEMDLYLLARLLGTCFLFSSAVILTGIWIDRSQLAWKISAGLLSAIGSGFILTFDHALWWDTYLPEYPYAFYVLGGTIFLSGLAVLVMALRGAGSAALILGIISTAIGIALLAIDMIDSIMFAPVLFSVLAIVGGVALLVTGLRPR
jgi:serine/threonine protein kinase